MALSKWKLEEESLDGSVKLEIGRGIIRWLCLTGNWKRNH